MATPVRRVVGKIGLVLTRKMATQRSAAMNKRKAMVGKLLARIDAKGRVIGCLLCAMGMWGCEQATSPHIDQPISQIIVQAVPQDPPAFEVTYTKWITPQVQVVLHMKTSAFGRSGRFGELRQADGKYVLFEMTYLCGGEDCPAGVGAVGGAVDQADARDGCGLHQLEADAVCRQTWRDVGGSRWPIKRFTIECWDC